MNLEIKSEIGARFKLVARKASTNEIARETDWILNTVLDTGLAQMSVGTWINRCCVGTGNSTPVPTQTQLDAFKASTSTTISAAKSGGIQVSSLPYYNWARETYRFGEGVAAGNISEVGLGWGNSNLWNRALIKDANGNPTTITVLSDEYLDVIAEIRLYPQGDFTGSFNFLNKVGEIVSNHAYTGKAFHSYNYAWFGQVLLSDIVIYDGNLGALPASGPSGTILGSGAPTTTVYPTPTSIKCTKKFLLTEASGAHSTLLIKTDGIMHGGGSGYQVQFTPKIIKTNLMELTYTVSMSWGRYTGA